MRGWEYALPRTPPRRADLGAETLRIVSAVRPLDPSPPRATCLLLSVPRRPFDTTLIDDRSQSDLA